MPANTYRIWAWGSLINRLNPKGPVRIGVEAVAKPGEIPGAIINEVICGDIARALRLPVPPAVVVQREADKVLHHASLNFSTAGQTPPPAIPRELTKDLPELACGIVLFDLWVLNYDRHEENMSYDSVTKELHVFDFGRALMAGPPADWQARMKKPDNFDLLDHSCLTCEMDRIDGFKPWADRIRALPEFVIREAVDDTLRIGLDKDHAAICTDFLLKRRRNLLRIASSNSAAFVNVRPTLPGIN